MNEFEKTAEQSKSGKKFPRRIAAFMIDRNERRREKEIEILKQIHESEKTTGFYYECLRRAKAHGYGAVAKEIEEMIKANPSQMVDLCNDPNRSPIAKAVDAIARVAATDTKRRKVEIVRKTFTPIKRNRLSEIIDGEKYTDSLPVEDTDPVVDTFKVIGLGRYIGEIPDYILGEKFSLWRDSDRRYHFSDMNVDLDFAFSEPRAVDSWIAGADFSALRSGEAKLTIKKPPYEYYDHSRQAVNVLPTPQ